jgi:hypothetical protein
MCGHREEEGGGGGDGGVLLGGPKTPSLFIPAWTNITTAPSPPSRRIQQLEDENESLLAKVQENAAIFASLASSGIS